MVQSEDARNEPYKGDVEKNNQDNAQCLNMDDLKEERSTGNFTKILHSHNDWFNRLYHQL